MAYFFNQCFFLELIALSGTNDKQAVSEGVEKHFTPA
jgi:hypothetical protein